MSLTDAATPSIDRLLLAPTNDIGATLKEILKLANTESIDFDSQSIELKVISNSSESSETFTIKNMFDLKQFSFKAQSQRLLIIGSEIINKNSSAKLNYAQKVLSQYISKVSELNLVDLDFKFGYLSLSLRLKGSVNIASFDDESLTVIARHLWEENDTLISAEFITYETEL